MENCDKQPHICIGKAQTRPVVLVVGDPARAQQIACCCEESEEISYNREYRIFDCFREGQYFTVCSHGVGAAGAGICFEELIANGAKVIIRVGTSGSLQPDRIHQGDIVICHSAVREEGVSRLIAPEGYPAVADPYVFQTMQEIAKTKKANIVYGMTLSSDLFYKSSVLPSTLETFAKAKVDIVEMEASALFVLAMIKGVKAGAICVVDGCPFQWKAGDYDPSGGKIACGKQCMFEIAIESASRFASEQNW